MTLTMISIVLTTMMINITFNFVAQYIARIILIMGAANERRRYYVMSSFIGWVNAQNDPWHCE